MVHRSLEADSPKREVSQGRREVVDLLVEMSSQLKYGEEGREVVYHAKRMSRNQF